ncbi:DUF1127 domain-containing protein [Paracoccus zeaxanthinifaciens]|uniref:DUF1127 domain-containing protein n=1 Tax=Paracoccus zeaxanthinifaciens TaxID=187400 RepID=UPI0004297164|nr:DUF1127 domain-containing protein [Paracoccus zeaxanthinifaciens]
MSVKSAAMLRVVTGHGILPRPNWLERIMTIFDVRRSRIALDRLTDKQLADIGLTRMDVEQEIARPAWDVPANWRR